MATAVPFQDFSEQLGAGIHNFEAAGHTYELYLTNNAPSVSADAIKTDLAGITEEGGYTETDTQNDWSETTGTGTATMQDIVFTGTGSGFGPYRYPVVFNESSTSPLDALCWYYDYGSSISTLSGETFTVDFGASAMTLAPA